MTKNTLILVLTLFMAGLAQAEEPAAKPLERFTKNITIQQATQIKIINHYGDIRIRKADDDQFIFHGVAQAQASQQVSLDVQQDKDLTVFTVQYSDPANTNQLDRFDLALVVPPLVALDIEIENGKLSTKGLGSAVRVRSDSADLQVKTSGPVDLYTKQGAIELSIKPVTSKIQSQIQTHQGVVSVIFYDDLPRFEINTGSHVTSNSVPVLQSLSTQQRTAYYGDINNNHHLSVKTDTGQISLIDLAH
ncbi:hypothetical protein [Marinicella meishanensis]|uniref:hypothetical protein n=1 Tax=Marinicella meishanensis TaxID=2873263 RepID=UPI001CC02646|nr:hypothetical protein [Marinicella sp. NBU2979]